MAQQASGLMFKQENGSVLQRTAVVWKTTLGSMAAWEIARFTGSNHPYLAPLTLILCLQVTIGQSLRFALYRALGTLIGVTMVGFFAKDIPVTGLSLGIVLFLSTAVMNLFRLKDLLIHQAALSILFVLYFEHHSAGYAIDRIKDTLIGCVVAVLFMTLIAPPNDTLKAKTKLETFAVDFAEMVGRAAQALRTNDLDSTRFDVNQSLSALLSSLQQLEQDVTQAKLSLTLNIYAKKEEVNQVQRLFHGLQHAAISFISLLKALRSEDAQKARNHWADILDAVSSDIRTAVYDSSFSATTAKSLLMRTGLREEPHSQTALYEASLLIESLEQSR